MAQPIQPLPTIGSPNSTEDNKVRNALAELQTILTSGIDTTNIATSARTLLTIDTATSTQALGSIADITGLSASVTPTVTSYYVAVVIATVRDNGATSTSVAYVDLDGSTVNSASLQVPLSVNTTFTTMAAGTLTAGSHTFKGRISGGGSPALTGTQYLYVITFPS